MGLDFSDDPLPQSNVLGRVTQLAVEFHSVTRKGSDFIKQYSQIVAELTKR